MEIYFAAPLFCEAERAFNVQLTEKLERAGFSVFLPQRDGVEIGASPYNDMSNEELLPLIFNTDRDRILKADILLFVLDGRIPDEGACFELGLAYGQKYLLERNKVLIGYQTDVRGGYLFLGEKINPMLFGALDHLVETEIDLLAVLARYWSPGSE